MPKRKHEESKEERWSRKLRKYEAKLQEKNRRYSQRIIYSSDEDDVQPEEHQEPVDTALADVGQIGSNEIEPTNDENIIVLPQLPEGSGNPVDDFYTELLEALGGVEPETVEFGEDIYGELATRYQQILTSGLKKEQKDELNKKYLFPKNVPFSKAPKLNPEIEAMLAETYRQRDKRLLIKQDQLGRALSALGKAMTCLVKKNPQISEVVRILNEAGKLIADSHHIETDTRRSLIIPLVEKSLSEPFKNRNRDTFLFGDGLGEVVKNSQGIKKTSKLIQAAPSTSSATLNFRGPSIQPRPQWSNQIYQHRVGGQRGMYQTRRRTLPPPARTQVPARRQPPPPPPPPHQRRQPPQRVRAVSDRHQR